MNAATVTAGGSVAWFMTDLSEVLKFVGAAASEVDPASEIDDLRGFKMNRRE